MRLILGLTRRLLMPICRIYSRRVVGDKPADRVMCLLCSVDFLERHGYWPHFSQPRSQDEKVSARMLFDRNPLWIQFCDKWRVREYVAERVGSNYLVPVLWRGDNPDEIPFDDLPSRFVIKATHGCAYNIIVQDKAQLDRAKTRRQLRQWLGENYCYKSHVGTEWAYSKVRPAIIIEEFLGEKGTLPVDYKFYCFNGRIGYVLLRFYRSGEHTKGYVDRDFTPFRMERGMKEYKGQFVRPDNYDEMIRVAETLAQGLDFIRVDLYSVNGRIYFGELTPYPAAGRLRFIPGAYDFVWGQKWRLAPFIGGPRK